MVIIFDYLEDEQSNETRFEPSPSSQSQLSLFSANFDPSNPLDFLHEVFDFIAQISNFFEKESAEKEIVLVVHVAKAKKAKSTVEVKVTAKKKLKEEKLVAMEKKRRKRKQRRRKRRTKKAVQ
ncbi:BOBBER 2 [Spatholobus suberectus]|nr:BOBBER 2 [Spatholobus suberectus]